MDSNTVVIEHCRNCKRHQWNTRHNEARYTSLFNEFKTALEEQGLKVVQTPSFRLGAFQIQMNGMVLFSKFKSQMFPDVKLMVDLIMEFREEYKNEAKRPDILRKFSEAVARQQENDRQKTQQSMSGSHIRNSRNAKFTQFFSSRRFSQPFIETFHSKISGGSSLSGRLHSSHIMERSSYLSPSKQEVKKESSQKSETIDHKHEVKPQTPAPPPKEEETKKAVKQEDNQNPEKAQTTNPAHPENHVQAPAGEQEQKEQPKVEPVA